VVGTDVNRPGLANVAGDRSVVTGVARRWPGRLAQRNVRALGLSADESGTSPSGAQSDTSGAETVSNGPFGGAGRTEPLGLARVGSELLVSVAVAELAFGTAALAHIFVEVIIFVVDAIRTTHAGGRAVLTMITLTFSMVVAGLAASGGL
jgi:hypothetical protein